jgi:2-dehydropantoate 2-reductase
MKIGILGMGGIGSFVGAKLTESYKSEEKTEIIFICRNKTKENIKKNGLTLVSENKTTKSQPYLVSDDSDEIGLLDILLVTTKSFSLDSALKEYEGCLKQETIIIPLQNGVNAKNIIEATINYDSSKILESCIYVASNIEKPGVVNHVGGPGKIFFGNTDELDFKWVEEVLVKGGLDANLTKDIKKILWKKYLFVSPVAAMTTALDITFGELAENEKFICQLEKMMKEVQGLANNFNIELTDDDIQDSLAMLSNFPYASKSSLQLDFENKNDKTEKANLIDYIVENGRKYGVSVGTYEEMNRKIETNNFSK